MNLESTGGRTRKRRAMGTHMDDVPDAPGQKLPGLGTEAQQSQETAPKILTRPDKWSGGEVSFREWFRQSSISPDDSSSVFRLGLGTAGIANLYEQVDHDDAIATVNTAWQEGVRYFDTAPLYGLGLSEIRLGESLASRTRDDFIISSKVGRLAVAAGSVSNSVRGEWPGVSHRESFFDYSYDGIMASVEESLVRLKMSRIDMLIVHDLDRLHHSVPEQLEHYFLQLTSSGVRALRELRDSGSTRWVGAAVNNIDLVPRLLDSVDIDFMLVAGEYTLLRHAAAWEPIQFASQRGVDTIVAGVYNSGILATGAGAGAHFDYGLATPDVLARVRAMEEVCHEFDVPLRAAALQFSLGHPAVLGGLVGAATPAEVLQSKAASQVQIPPEFWIALKKNGSVSVAY